MCIARLDRDRAFRACSRMFLAWRDERAKPAARRRAAKIRAREFFQTTRVHETFLAWRHDALPLLRSERLVKRRAWDVLDALVQSARWRLGMAAAHEAAKTERRKKNVLRFWRDAARAASKEAAAETYARTVSRKRILRDVFFRAFANPSREARDARRADAHLLRGRAAASLRAWRATTERLLVRKKKKSRASSFRGARLVAVTFKAWRGPFLFKKRLKRADSKKLEKALATRDALVKCRAFIGWSYRARVVGRAKRRVLNDALRLRRAFLTTRAFSAWGSVTVTHRASDALSDAKLATAVAALAATFVGRVFDAWLEKTKTKTARRAVSAFASRRFAKIVSRKTLLGWKKRCDTKKASRENLVLAMDHYDRKRLAFTALEAWVVFLVRRRLKRANAWKAESKHARRALDRSVAAWMAYVEARRKKRLAIRDALDAHKIDVTRHACAAWLREGLRRREARRTRSLESVADDAARRTAEIWRVVFRCAEKWRSVSRRRARRRGDGVRPSLPVANRFAHARFVPVEKSNPNRSTRLRSASSPERPVEDSSSVERRGSGFEGFRGDPKRDDDEDDDEDEGTVAFAERAEVRFPAAAAAAAFAPRRRPPPRRLDGDGALDAPRRDAGGPSPVPGKPPRAPPFPLGAPLSVRRASLERSAVSARGAAAAVTNEDDVSDITQEDVLSPSSLDAHERCICEFEALKAESARVRDELNRLDASVADGAVAKSVASVRRAALATAARLAREKRAALLPAVRAAAAALGEYRSDMATSVASGW